MKATRALPALLRLASLALCLTAGAVGVSTYFCSAATGGQIPLESASEFHPVFWDLRTSRGVITLVINRYRLPLTAHDVVDSFRNSASRQRPMLSRYPPSDFRPFTVSPLSPLGFELSFGSSTRGVVKVNGFGLSLPLWFLLILFAAWPLSRPMKRMIHALRNSPPPSSDSPVATSRRSTLAAGTSLLACVALFATLHLTQATGWTTRFSRGATLIELAAQQRKLCITVVNDWPQPQPLTFQTRPDPDRPLYPFREELPKLEETSVLGWTWLGGTVSFFLEKDGSVSLLPYGKDPFYGRYSSDLPYHQFQMSLQQLAMLAAVWPGLWIGARVRRRLRLFTAIERSLCPHCGYNLVGNQSGICPECGRAPQPGNRPSAIPT